VIVAVDDAEAATADYRLLLGREAYEVGGSVSRFGLDNTLLELVPREAWPADAPAPPPSGVAGLVFQEDGRETPAWLPADRTRGLPIGLAPEAVDAPPPSRPFVAPDVAVAHLDHVVVSTGDLEAARALYGRELGLRLALDRAFEKRGIQILFFRVAGVTVEVVGALAGAPRIEGGPEAFAGDRDRFGGLAWRAADVRGLRARLAGEGFDVSETRPGHKPGTAVCTVRSRTHGVPTLLIGPDAG
jgi:catechol 2,3-dioxygenase-like lactoylglutathione lyase family enzyme